METDPITVDLPDVGELVAVPSGGPEHPGISIKLRRPGVEPDLSLALVELCADEADLPDAPHIITRVWGDEADDEYTHRIVHHLKRRKEDSHKTPDSGEGDSTPALCTILGVKVSEPFGIRGSDKLFWIAKDGTPYASKSLDDLSFKFLSGSQCYDDIFRALANPALLVKKSDT